MIKESCDSIYRKLHKNLRLSCNTLSYASGKGKRGKLSADQKRSALWSKCAAKIGKVAKCAAGVKSLRTTA